MKKGIVQGLLLALCAHPAHAAGTQPSAGKPSEARAPDVPMKDGFPITSKRALYPLSDVKRGQRGIGYTVFSGAEVKPFEVEVLGLLENMVGNGRHIILARLSGEDIEFTGVIAGMSGSPVYIDGKLLGAVSYRFGAFSKQPIAGITPIESMLAVYGEEIEPRPPELGAVLLPSGARGERSLPNRPRGLSVAELRDRDRLPALELPRPRPVMGPYDPVAIETPITVSGLEPEVYAGLEPLLKAAGFVASSGGAPARKLAPRIGDQRQLAKNVASASGLTPAAPIAPGAPIAGLLMSGDISIAGTGTVTFFDGEEVLAFGHPFFGWGHVTFPMATSAILHTLATPLGSYKMGSAALEVGSITHDRLTAIAGKLGAAARMIPVHVRLKSDAQEKKPLTTDVEIIEDPVWLPLMLEVAVNNSIAGRMGFESGGTVDVRARVEVEDRTMELVDSYSGEHPARVGAVAARDVSTVVGLIARNNLVPARVRSMDLELSVRRKVELAAIEQVTPEKNVVAPGERLGLTVRLRPFKAPPVLARIEVQIPTDMSGEVELFVGGGIEMDRRVGEMLGDRFPTDLDQLLGLLSERREARAIFARAFTARPGLRSDADILSSLPPAERALYAGGPGRHQKALTEAMGPEISVPYADVVLGGVAVPLSVIR